MKTTIGKLKRLIKEELNKDPVDVAKSWATKKIAELDELPWFGGFKELFLEENPDMSGNISDDVWEALWFVFLDGSNKKRVAAPPQERWSDRNTTTSSSVKYEMFWSMTDHKVAKLPSKAAEAFKKQQIDEEIPEGGEFAYGPIPNAGPSGPTSPEDEDYIESTGDEYADIEPSIGGQSAYMYYVANDDDLWVLNSNGQWYQWNY